MTAKTSWLDDPRMARRLARLHWVVLVAVFVLLTRFDFGGAVERAILAALVPVLGLLNAPVVVGLYKSRAEAHTRPFRLVALAFVLRVGAAVWMLWLLGS